ncbi:hypothetical protein GYMLUDRAFT_33203 [Collybiopsis luxurians FD-317 M1]|nr:hypothetical protein GYMLUDRAFT_33203 [Collybiopsis luxurians FD-317 M1]
MFSQFRHAVETFAPQPRRSTDNSAQNDGRSSPHSRAQSVDATSPTAAQLAENALSNLRKSFSPQPSGAPNSPQKSPPTPRPHKSTLEERLRAAAFTIGEVSSSTTPQQSSRASPAPLVSIRDHPLSPASTPLPDSPVVVPSLSQDPLGVLPAISKVQEATNGSNEYDVPDKFPVVEDNSINKDAVTGEVEETVEDSKVAVDEAELSDNKEYEAFNLEAISAEENTHSPDADRQTLPPGESFQIENDSVDGKLSAGESSPHSINSTLATVEELQQQIQLVEQRFTDVSTSFKRLQAEKAAADAVLRELTPLESVRESEALRDYLKNISLKIELSQDEIKRLNTKLETQEGRIEEMRDTHRLESHSQSEQIDKLKKQLEESELLLKASQESSDETQKLKEENERLNGEIAKGKETIKDEEEKRVKAISLLKTVRQKLTKAEKDRDDALKETSALKEKEKNERAREEEEKAKHRNEIETLGVERDRVVAGLKAQLDKELVAAQERHEKELAALRAEFELGTITVKATHDKEISTKNSRITQLENSLNSVVRDKNSFFEQLQLRQAEVESSQAHLESLQSQNAELQHQLRELEDRIILLNEELLDARREHELNHKDSTSSADTARLLASVETKYEGKLTELRRVLNSVEKERNESDAEWSRKLREKNSETERLNRQLGSATQSKAVDEGVAEDLKNHISRLQEQLVIRQNEISSLQRQITQLKENESSVTARETESDTKIKVLEQGIEEARSRENQLRTNNKTLRDELRKVQSSAALLDRQRNPGVGYWTSRAESVQPASTSSDSVASSTSSGRTSTDKAAAGKEEEEVNLEYLRNVILQFLEHKEMRPNLVRVLSIILHFTPQETRRLIAKV